MGSPLARPDLIPSRVFDDYKEFKFTEHFGLPTISYEDMPAHRVDWWMQFIAMDAEVKAEQDQKRREAEQRR